MTERKHSTARTVQSETDIDIGFARLWNDPDRQDEQVRLETLEADWKAKSRIFIRIENKIGSVTQIGHDRSLAK